MKMTNLSKNYQRTVNDPDMPCETIGIIRSRKQWDISFIKFYYRYDTKENPGIFK